VISYKPECYIAYRLTNTIEKLVHILKIFSILLFLVLLVNSCQNKPIQWNGPRLMKPRDQLTVEQLQGDSVLALTDMSFFAKPEWANQASRNFSGSVSFADTKMLFPKERDPYPGEDIFPGITIDFITNDGELIPIQKNIIITRNRSSSFWDVILGTGKLWQEDKDGEWTRGSFPLMSNGE